MNINHADRALKSKVEDDDAANINVCLRLRPFLASEETSLEPEPAWSVSTDRKQIFQALHTNPDPTRKTSFRLDRVFAPCDTTNTIYDENIQTLVQSAMEGYHASVFAYGQTSTGKTYTMMGDPSSKGIIPLAIQDVFNYIKRGTDSQNNKREYLLRVTFMEIYNEMIHDLLAPTASAKGRGSLITTPIRIFESKQEGVVVRGLKEEIVTTPEEVFKLLKEGESRRQTGFTNLNKHSSRSHSIFRLIIESRNRSSSSKNKAVRVSSLSLVDLAGSESAKNTGAVGTRQKEGQYINKSLMTLGLVIWKLSEISSNRNKRNSDHHHIPYRDSKLTRLLQPSLSGNAKICIIVNISPFAKNIDESYNTLKFASRAKRIQQHAVVTEVSDEKTLLQSYRNEIDELKKQLKEAHSKQEEQKKKNESTYDKEDEEALGVAIQYLERLILKTKTNKKPSPSSPIGSDDDLLTCDDEDVYDNQIHESLLSPKKDGNSQQQPDTLQYSLDSDFLLTDSNSQNKDNLKDEGGDDVNSGITSELHSIQTLLGSVLKKKNGNYKVNPNEIMDMPSTVDKDNQTPTKYQYRDKEVEVLRAKLQEQEVASSLRKADGAFLQVQLAEKDRLLQEVTKIVEAVEKRQLDLEEENRKLKHEWLRSMAMVKSREKDIMRTMALLKSREAEIDRLTKLNSKSEKEMMS